MCLKAQVPKFNTSSDKKGSAGYGHFAVAALKVFQTSSSFLGKVCAGHGNN